MNKVHILTEESLKNINISFLNIKNIVKVQSQLLSQKCVETIYS